MGINQARPNLVAKPTNQNHRQRKLYVVWSVLIVLFSILSIESYGSVKQALNSARRGQAAFLDAQTSIETQAFKETLAHLDIALSSFRDAKQSMNKLVWLRVIPWASTQYNAAQHVLNAGISIGEAVRSVADFASSTIEPLSGGGQLSLDSLTSTDKRIILEKFANSEQILINANDKIDSATDEIEKIPERGLIGPLKNAIDPINKKLPLIKALVGQFVTFARIIPKIAGYPEPKTYLFLLENNTEIRPTGGFIGTYGILKVKDGEISAFTTDNVYNLDVPAEEYLSIAPPEPLVKYLKADRWFFRDSNWSPDFPEAAEKALWFYEQERGPISNFDGVIAVTPTFIESLIELTGDLTVQGITFNKENFVDTLQYQVERGYYRQGISDSERKEVIGQLSSMLLDRLLSLPQSKWDDFWNTFTNDIERKQILIYLRDANAQSTVSQENWGGEVAESPGDYVMIIDANMAALKSDPGVMRSIDYRVEQVDGSAQAKLKITYRNEGTITWKSTRYRSYTRIYVPLGSRLIDSTGFVTNDKLQNGQPTAASTDTEVGKTVFAGFIAVEPQSEIMVELNYTLPEPVSRQFQQGDYSLLWQKQAGAAAYQLSVNLVMPFKSKVRLPADWLDIDNHDSVGFRGALSKDINFIVTN